jgi:hypothetical protein
MTPEQVQKALEALILEGEAVIATAATNGYGGKFVDIEPARKWGFSLAACLGSVFGATHHLAVQARAHSILLEGTANWKSLLGIAQAARASWANGFVFDTRRLVRADVESDLIGQATALLEANYDRAAAVIAGAVLEAHLRDIAPSWGVAVVDAKGKPLTLEPLNIELKRAEAYDGIVRSRITHLATLRNDAAHGGPFEGRADDVQRMIRDVIDTCDRVVAK